jgi:N-acyl-D-glutamate deacylase
MSSQIYDIVIKGGRAQILEKSVPQMRKKGRIQVGMDADVVVFDLKTIKDNATFTQPARLSSGFRHLLVNGTPIIRDGKRIGTARPGKPIRRPV